MFKNIVGEIVDSFMWITMKKASAKKQKIDCG